MATVTEGEMKLSAFILEFSTPADALQPVRVLCFVTFDQKFAAGGGRWHVWHKLPYRDF